MPECREAGESEMELLCVRGVSSLWRGAPARTKIRDAAKKFGRDERRSTQAFFLKSRRVISNCCALETASDSILAESINGCRKQWCGVRARVVCQHVNREMRMSSG